MSFGGRAEKIDAFCAAEHVKTGRFAKLESGATSAQLPFFREPGLSLLAGGIYELYDDRAEGLSRNV